MQDDKDSTRKRTRPLREHGAETRIHLRNRTNRSTNSELPPFLNKITATENHKQSKPSLLIK